MERVQKRNGESAGSQRMVQARFAFTSASRESERANEIENSPLMAAQRKKLDSLFGGAIQRQGPEEEEPLQGKFDAVQRAEEEEEPLQGKFEAVQRAGDEEELLQGKFETAQRAGMEEEEPLQGKFSAEPAVQMKEEPLQAKSNDTGLPDTLKSGVESLSGMSMDNVKVHYNSPQPAQLNALAYAQGTDIHVAPGQEQHLPHEAWHVVQQAQGRVKPTMQMKEGVPVNDDAGLEQEADVMGAKAVSAGQMMQKKEAATAASASPATVQREGGATTASATDSDTAAKVEAAAEPAPEAAKTATDESSGTEVASLPDSDGPGMDAWRAEMEAATNPEGEVTTKSGFEVNESLPPKEKLELVKKGDEVISAVSTAGTIASGTDTLVTAFETSKEPAKEGLAIFDKTKSMFGTIFDRVTGFVTGLVQPIIKAGLSILGMKEKWAQWSVFKNTATMEKGGKTQPRPGAPEEAKYALTKIPSGFMRHVKDVFLHIVEFTSTLLTMIPGAQIVGAPMKLFSMICNLVDSVYKAGKSIYQKLFGEKKDKYSGSLLDKALSGDEGALQLILNLKLGSIAGTGYRLFDWVKGGLNEVSLNNLANKVGISVTKAERVIDRLAPGSGGPQNTIELSSLLHMVCDNSAASKELLRGEIKETMTGFGK